MDKSTLINKEFSRSFPGYDIKEVDSFLDEIAREFDNREHELEIARLRIKILLEEIERGRLAKKQEKDGQEAAEEGTAEDECDCEQAEACDEAPSEEA